MHNQAKFMYLQFQLPYDHDHDHDGPQKSLKIWVTINTMCPTHQMFYGRNKNTIHHINNFIYKTNI
jgi:hypothetical protein